MNFRKLFIALLFILSLVFCTFCHPEEPDFYSVTQIPINQNTQEAQSYFEVHFIDVGQADAMLVLCDGKSMMIDGGNVDDSNLIYSYLKKHDVNHLDYIVATHAHEDHIGGLAGALNFATAGTVFCPTREYSSKAFKNFKKYVLKNNIDITVPSPGDSFELGSAKAEIIASNSDTEDMNETSIVIKMTYKNTSFLFTGDAERTTEQTIIMGNYNIDCNLLMVGHHGSQSSTTYPFLRQIMPDYAVISVGADNTYGHPTEAVLSRLEDAEAKILRTDLLGDIICRSDGDNLTFSYSKNLTDDVVSEEEYVLNTGNKKFHLPECQSSSEIKKKNKQFFVGNREKLISDGYVPCKSCNP